jgi:signal peptidase
MSKRQMSAKKQAKVRGFLLKAISALFVIALVAAPTILHNFYGYGISPVLSGSMRPLAEPGDAFITVDRPASTLKVGDIVTLHSAKSLDLYAHRIVDIRQVSGQIRIVTKGDANPSAEIDPYLVSPDTKVPVTTARVMWIGHVLVYLTSIQGRQAGLSLVVLANILALILAMFKKKVKERNLKAEQIYKDLFQEASLINSNEVKKMQLYKELYTESRSELQTIKGN